jgi:hypothetical protein
MPIVPMMTDRWMLIVIAKSAGDTAGPIYVISITSGKLPRWSWPVFIQPTFFKI